MINSSYVTVFVRLILADAQLPVQPGLVAEWYLDERHD
jgi:hypothetical protein